MQRQMEAPYLWPPPLVGILCKRDYDIQVYNYKRFG